MVGADLPGRVRIEKLIGVGAMGRVYRGFQSGVDRAVAVKILHAELSTDKTMVARFHREAKVASLLAHPGVVDVVMTGEVPAGSPASGALYIVMEFVDGISLRSALAAAEGAMQLPRALRIVLQMCDAVGEAHARGIVHRDLKPENVMLVRRANDADFVKVLDFGMARMPAGSGPALTRAGLIFGTARYISPEGAIGEPVGPPGDVYAIATILYQALAGRTPFEGESAVEVLGAQINSPAPPLQSHARAAYVPAAIARVIERNLGKRPEERGTDARAFATALLDAARASGLAPEALLVRSSLLGENAHESAFHSAAPTQQLPFGADLAALGTAGARGSNGAPPRREPHAQSGDAPELGTARAQPAGGNIESHRDAASARMHSERDAPPRGERDAHGERSHARGEYGAGLAPSRGERDAHGSDDALVVAPPKSTRSTLFFLVGCIAGGAALAALGAGFRAESPTRSSAASATPPALPAGSVDAGLPSDAKPSPAR